MRRSNTLSEEHDYVEATLGDSVICNRCNAVLADYADKCSADISDPCPGFRSIEKVISEFKKLTRDRRTER